MKLYLKYFSIHLKSLMQHKVSFFLTTIGQFITSFAGFLSIYFMMSRFNRIEGFAFGETLLCFSVVMTSFALAECFFRGFDAFSVMIGNGEFDRIMLRPRNEIFQVLAAKIDFSRLGKLVQAVIVAAWAFPNCGIAWTADKVLTVILMMVSGTAVFSGLFVIYAAICFFTTDALEFMNLFTDGGREFGRYPFSVYGEGVLKFFTFVIPLALFQYYPLLYLTGRCTSMLYAAAPLFGFVFLLPCYAIWKIGIKHYKSTGS